MDARDFTGRHRSYSTGYQRTLSSAVPDLPNLPALDDVSEPFQQLFPPIDQVGFGLSFSAPAQLQPIHPSVRQHSRNTSTNNMSAHTSNPTYSSSSSSSTYYTPFVPNASNTYGTSNGFGDTTPYGNGGSSLGSGTGQSLFFPWRVSQPDCKPLEPCWTQ